MGQVLAPEKGTARRGPSPEGSSPSEFYCQSDSSNKEILKAKQKSRLPAALQTLAGTRLPHLGAGAEFPEPMLLVPPFLPTTTPWSWGGGSRNTQSHKSSKWGPGGQGWGEVRAQLPGGPLPVGRKMPSAWRVAGRHPSSPGGLQEGGEGGGGGAGRVTRTRRTGASRAGAVSRGTNTRKQEGQHRCQQEWWRHSTSAHGVGVSATTSALPGSSAGPASLHTKVTPSAPITQALEGGPRRTGSSPRLLWSSRLCLSPPEARLRGIGAPEEATNR